MKKLILATVFTILFAACSDKPKVESKPAIAYDLTQSGDSSILTVEDFESVKINFVFLDSAVTATGMTYDKLAEACQASMKESKHWLKYPENFRYNGDSKVIVEKGLVFVIVEAKIVSSVNDESPISYLIRANLDGTIDPYRAFVKD
jgi:hypothetical protein